MGVVQPFEERLAAIAAKVNGETPVPATDHPQSDTASDESHLAAPA